MPIELKNHRWPASVDDNRRPATERKMISVQDALQILQDNQPEARFDTVELAHAHGRFLAESICAPEPSPRYTNSAMDGYALRWSDVMGADEQNSVSLKIVGESKAGFPYNREVYKDEAVHISTGAMLPQGADTIIRVEDTLKINETEVQILTVRSQGQDVRYEGEEFRFGDKLLSAGIRLSARHLALLATIGQQQVKVYSIPRVSVLITGSELASASEKKIKPYQIRDSNSIMLTSVLQEAGAAVHSCSLVQDELLPTINAISRAAASGVDIIICSGGISVGEHDHIKEATETVGFKQLFWRIRQKPGKPLFAAKKNDTYLFGLPGNPVSAYMCFTHYIRPLLYTGRGRRMAWKTLAAMTESTISNTGKRTNFIRVQLAQEEGKLPRIVDVKKQGSHMLSSIVNADGYIILEPGITLQPGEVVYIYLF